MYFVIIGQHKEIAEQAISYLHPSNIKRQKNDIVTFDTDLPERLLTAWFVIKWGIVCDTKELPDHISGFSLLGALNKEIGMMLKKQMPQIRRFKLVDLVHSDMEIKKEGVEVVDIDGKQRWIVKWYQNIPLYEAVDFGKPVWGMNIGMMPSKLAHTMINIGIGHHEEIGENWKLKTEEFAIWDPFCGFWTTNFLANHLWYNTICSDINITQAKSNMKRRSSQTFAKDFKTLILKHDVTAAFPLICHHADIIVTEWWLWHLVSNRTAPHETQEYAKEVEILYKAFFDNITLLKKQQKSDKNLTLVITIPVWLKYNISVSQDLADYLRSLDRKTTLLMTPYSRKWQSVGRQILIANIWW